MPFEELRRERRFQLCDASRNGGGVDSKGRRRLPYGFEFAHREKDFQIVPDDALRKGGRILLHYCNA